MDMCEMAKICGRCLMYLICGNDVDICEMAKIFLKLLRYLEHISSV